MGFFDAMKQKAGAAVNDCKNAYTLAQGMDVRSICAAMKEAKGMTLGGYNMSLREKCEAMSSSDLMALYQELKDTKVKFKLDLNPFSKDLVKEHPAIDTIESILVQRNVLTQDEDGHIL